MPTIPEFDLPELASLADVTVRTIRYYVQQGLLPSPDVRGPLTRYTAGHLDRLQLIRQLKREHLPLSEIRRQLEVLDDAAVHRVIAQAPRKKPPRSAAAYVRDVLAKSAREPDLQRGTAAAPGSARVASAEAQYALHELPPRLESRSTWERIALSSDIELHVRRPLSREQNRQLERLLDAARQVMSEDS